MDMHDKERHTENENPLILCFVKTVEVGPHI